MKESKNKKVIRRVGTYLLEHKLLFGLTLGLACGMTLLSVAVPSVIQKVLDEIFKEGLGDGGYLAKGLGVIAALFLLKETLNCLRIRVNNNLEQKVIFKLRKDLHDKLLDLPISFYDRRKSGDISSRVVEDVQSVERAILDGTEQGVIAVLTLIGVTIMMFVQEPRLAFLVFLPLPVLAVMAFRYSKVSKRNWRLVREASGDLNSILVEDIQGNPSDSCLRPSRKGKIPLPQNWQGGRKKILAGNVQVVGARPGGKFHFLPWHSCRRRDGGISA